MKKLLIMMTVLIFVSTLIPNVHAKSSDNNHINQYNELKTELIMDKNNVKLLHHMYISATKYQDYTDLYNPEVKLSKSKIIKLYIKALENMNKLQTKIIKYQNNQ